MATLEIPLNLPGLVKALSAIATIALFIVPGWTALQIRKKQSCGDLAPIQFTGILFNACVWGLYGVAIRNVVPLSVANVVGLASGIFCLATFRKVGTAQQRSEATLQGCAVLIVTSLLAAFFFNLLVDGAEQASPTPELRLLGMCAVGSSFGLYGAPLSSVRTVIQTGSSEALSPVVSGASMVNAVLFGIYGILENDPNIYIPGTVGSILSAVQIVLILFYPANPPQNRKPSRLHSPMSQSA
jgi:uncharacterized protein with PQ loop repeat